MLIQFDNYVVKFTKKIFRSKHSEQETSNHIKRGNPFGRSDGSSFSRIERLMYARLVYGKR